MFQALSGPIIRSIITAVDSQWLSINSTTVLWPTARFWTTLKLDVTTKFTIQRNECYTSDRQLQLLYSWWWAWRVPETSCNKTKILLLHLVGYLYTYVENDTRNHEPKVCHVPHNYRNILLILQNTSKLADKRKHILVHGISLCSPWLQTFITEKPNDLP
jgi:hypothetical protein